MITRIVTGLILLGISIVALLKGGILFYTLVSMAGTLTMFEITKLFENKDIRINSFAVIIWTLLLFAFFPFLKVKGVWSNPIMFSLFFIQLAIILVELRQKQLFQNSRTVFVTARLILFITVTFPYIILLRELENGLKLSFLAYIIIWTADIMAYFGGRFFGRTPLTAISPKKTVEGSLIGLVASVVGASIFLWCNGAFTIPLIGLSAALAGISQMGDLHESLVKRMCGAKDSSTILPGHGGFYDRFDSSVWVVPLIYMFVSFGWLTL